MDMQHLAATSSQAASGALQGTNTPCLRAWLGLDGAAQAVPGVGCLPGAERMLTLGCLPGAEELSQAQQDALRQAHARKLVFFDCVAETGKTTLLKAVVYCLDFGGPSSCCRPATVPPFRGSCNNNEPTDLLQQYADDAAADACAEQLRPVEAAHTAIEEVLAQMQQNPSWGSWHANWHELKELHAMLHVHLFLRVFPTEAAARKKAIAKLQVLVVTTSYARKFLTGEDSWRREFQNKPLLAMMVDEAHQEDFIKIAALLGSCDRCFLFGDSRQEQTPSAVEAEANTAFSWAARAHIPTRVLPKTFRVGPEITAALHATGDYPGAQSYPTAPRTKLLPLLFAPWQEVLSTGREVCCCPFMLEHLVHMICIEACVATTALELLIIAYYSVQVAFLQENVRHLCLACIGHVAAALGLQVTEVARTILNNIQACLPLHSKHLSVTTRTSSSNLESSQCPCSPKHKHSESWVSI